MATFVEIDFNLFWDYYEIAIEKGSWLKLKDPSNHQRRDAFYKKHNIDTTLSAKAMLKIGQMNIAVIESGPGEGYYLFSIEREICYKYTKKDTILFEKNNWGGSNW